jgi:hypothetical protein
MSNVFRKRGFDAHKQEEERRKKEAAERQGKLWRYFLKDGEEDVPIRFLTEEPILFYEHNIKTPDGKFSTVTCGGDDCELCATSKPSYKGAWLVVDGRSVTIDEKKDGKPTGKKKEITDQVRLYVRGSTDIAKLDRLSRKFGLTSRPWFATKTGSGTSTSYELDRGEPSELTAKQIENLLAKVPEEMRNHYDGTDDSLYDIVEANIFDDVELGESESKPQEKSTDLDEDDVDLDDGVSSVEEEEKPKKKALTSKKKNVFKRK